MLAANASNGRPGKSPFVSEKANTNVSKTLFHLTAVATFIFIVTVLAMVMMLIGDAKAPVNVWFNVHGATVMTVEVLAIGLFGMLAMFADRNETLHEQRNRTNTPIASQPPVPPTADSGRE